MLKRNFDEYMGSLPTSSGGGLTHSSNCVEFTPGNHQILYVHIEIENNTQPFLLLKKDIQDNWMKIFNNKFIQFGRHSTKGKSCFLSSLYVLIKQIKEKNQFLGKIRQLCGGYQPLISALYTLLMQGIISDSQLQVLVECFFVIFRSILPEKIGDLEVFEHSNSCFNVILSSLESKDANDFVEPTNVNLKCPLTGERVKKTPAFLKDNISQAFNRKELGIHVSIYGKYDDKAVSSQDIIDDMFLQRILPLLDSQEDNFDIWEEEENDFIRVRLKKTHLTNPISHLPPTLPQWVQFPTNIIYLSLVPTLVLKTTGLKLPVLTLNDKGNFVVIQSPVKTGGFHLYDPESGKILEIKPDDFAPKTVQYFSCLNSQLPKSFSFPIEEGILVIFDRSASMRDKFDNGLSRLSCVKEFWNAFAYKTMAFNYFHQIGLIQFNNHRELSLSMCSEFISFCNILEEITPRGSTALFDAISYGIEILVKYRMDHPGALLRLLCLSDGEDNESNTTPQYLLKSLQKNLIIIDSIFIGPKCDERLKVLSHFTNGICVNPDNMEQGLKIFEYETFLKASLRWKGTPDMLKKPLKLEKSFDYYIQNTKYELPPLCPFPKETQSKVIKASQAAKLKTKKKPRILQELKDIQQHLGDSSEIFVFPVSDCLYFWRLLLIGPEETPYQGGLFECYINFPNDYPHQPPEVRMVTKIYHCNINDSGRICHPVFLDFYSPSMTRVYFILQCILGLLKDPNPDDPLDTVKATLLRDNKSKYLELAREHTSKYSKSITLDEWKKANLIE